MNTATAIKQEAVEFDYKAATRAILPRLAKSTDASEANRRLDDDAAAALKESGLTKVLTPKKYGGFEMSPSAHIWACAEVGKVCSSASWVLMVCVAHDYIIGRFSDQCQKEVYEGDADNLLAGCLQPQGTIERVEGGYRLNGRWQFGSGCDHSPWFILGARLTNAEEGEHFIHHVMIPKDDLEIDDTWFTLGMRGTGSKDLVVKDVFVPEYRTMPTYPTFLGETPHTDARCFQLPVYAGLASMLTASVLGMAERGLAAFLERTSARKSAYGVVKAQSSLMQKRVSESTAEIVEARRLLESICARFDTAMEGTGSMTEEERIQIRFDAAYIAELCRRAMERMYASSGAHGIYESSVLQRAYRDVNTACHHAVVDFDHVSELQGMMTLLGTTNENKLAAPFA